MRQTPSSTYKKVVIRKLDAGLVKGYVDPSRYLAASGVEILDRDGRLLSMPLEEIKGIFFVREFEGNAHRPERKVFSSRPKLSGLWIRMTFKDKEVLEGLISNNLLELDQVGFMVTPPDVHSNNLKVFVPRSALEGMEVLGVISNEASRRFAPRGAGARRPASDTSRQIGLFPSSRPAEAK